MLARAARETEFAEWLLQVATGHPSAAAGAAPQEQPPAGQPTAEPPEGPTDGDTEAAGAGDTEAVGAAAAAADAGGEAVASEVPSEDAAPLDMEAELWAMISE